MNQLLGRVTDFLLWTVPKALSPKSFVHNVVHVLVDSSLHLVSRFFFLFVNIPSFIKKGVLCSVARASVDLRIWGSSPTWGVEIP